MQENMSILPETAVEMSKVEQWNKSHSQNTKGVRGELDGLQTFIHNTRDRLEEIEEGILVCSHQRIGIGEDEKLLCNIQSNFPKKQLDPGLFLL